MVRGVDWLHGGMYREVQGINEAQVLCGHKDNRLVHVWFP